MRGGLLGVLPTFYDQTTRQSQESLRNLRNSLGDRVLPKIHRATVLREATAEGMTIFEKDSDSRAAEEYWQLIKIVLRSKL